MQFYGGQKEGIVENPFFPWQGKDNVFHEFLYGFICPLW